MTTFTVWKFDTTDGAERAARILVDAEHEDLVTVIDHAVVSWPEGAAKPAVHHSHDDEKRATGWGALWGLLLGALFFLPVIGAAAGAAIGVISRHLAHVGIDRDQLDRIRQDVVPGTSALFAVTENADLDRLGERFHGLHQTLVSTNLTDAERAVLTETFD
ncbi:DUF1269 domain-containing protein [Cellulomonas denverensis]|uniref:DUF1269 domain-containing protein n=1 Tax=Cellulomonas denverensis TaxID=264297 RepID=A0A7X6R044_9CELL|nr:DUF1269 domain-containing protein [Cellulomonas denverensis]NKY23756.1 DUF1269 domain-containing protein [Cellulomonas denverensis]GIG25751.1 membrane protein [Cellulomonas denverensis]